MDRSVIPFHKRLATRLILTVGLVLLASLSIWAYLHIEDQKSRLMEYILAGTDRLTNTIRLGTHYAMMLNSRDDITQIITNVGQQKKIENIRIYNKQGQIKFSNRSEEVDRVTNIEDEACYICHRTNPPKDDLALEMRTRIFRDQDGHRMLGIITPIGNAPGCSTGDCHFHPQGKKILGALDLVVSLADTDQEILAVERNIITFTASIFLITSAIILVFLLRFVNRPIRRMVDGTLRIANGDYSTGIDMQRNDEMGLLAGTIDRMAEAIAEQQAALNKQRDEYQELFERVPCLITVQNRQFDLLRYNREFARRFAPKPGDKCYRAYKNRDCKCEVCPVEQTFRDGKSHYAEESGVNKDGTQSYWIVSTSPIRNANGEVVAAMEISHDITARRQLEVDLERSEKKYHAIFSNIPNPVFVLEPHSYNILDCNMNVVDVYGYSAEELINTSFLRLFPKQERQRLGRDLADARELHQVRQTHKSGHIIYVNINVSPSEYSGKKVLLVTTNDITERLEAEQQLLQASKMATLGEMATGVAHELNQPLSVIKTSSSFFMRKLAKNEPINAEVLATMLTKVDSNVDRATRIINHMRQFARKSDMALLKVSINDVLHSAFEIFSQQLKVRGIAVKWQLAESLPRIEADAQRLEQVFINLLINARDAIEEKWEHLGQASDSDHITISSLCEEMRVICLICDTGVGIEVGIEEKIFEPFFTTKEVGKGTGLGLSISYGIVQECHGTIRFLPGGKDGTCFELTFPVADDGSNEEK